MEAVKLLVAGIGTGWGPAWPFLPRKGDMRRDSHPLNIQRTGFRRKVKGQEIEVVGYVGADELNRLLKTMRRGKGVIRDDLRG